MEPRERDEIILNYLPHVRKIARHVWEDVFNRLAAVTVEDLTSTGMVGMIEALDRFDSNKSIDMYGWVTKRARGAMIDSVRTNEARSLRRYWGLPPNPMLPERPDRICAEKEDKARLNAAVLTLSDQEQNVIRLYYVDEMKLAEIGELMHRDESRICQIKTGAMKKLRGFLCPN